MSIANRRDVLHLVIGPTVGNQGGQAPHNIEEVPSQRVQGAPATSGLRLGVQADQGRKERQQRQGAHQNRSAPDIHPGEHQHGQHRDGDCRDQRRKVRGDVGLDALGARAGQRHRLGGVRSPIRRTGHPTLKQTNPNLTTHLVAGLAADHLVPRRHQATKHQDGAQHGKGHGQRGATHDCGHRGGHRNGLPQGEDARDDAHPGESGHPAAGAGQRSQQRRIDRAHQASVLPPAAVPAGAAGFGLRPASGRAARATSVGMWWPDTRLRNVQ